MRCPISHINFSLSPESWMQVEMYLASDSSQVVEEKGLWSWHKGQRYCKLCFIPFLQPSQNQQFTSAA